MSLSYDLLSLSYYIFLIIAIMKLNTPEFKAVITEEVITLKSMFDDNGYELRIAGGAVRDLLLGIQPKDLDFATTATPTEMKEMFNYNNVRLINTNGEKHGTITPRINDSVNFEVTTLRIDVVTDGRRAVVEFTKDWKLDANRRDLTINSMFLGLDGTVYDYFNGYEDLMQKRVVFVGDATTRIQEDYLRILRYFRFYGRISVKSDNHDNNTLLAIQKNAEGLLSISGERIWMELKKILEGNFAGDILRLIIELGIGPSIGLPDDGNFEELQLVWTRSQNNHVQLKPITLLCSLLKTDEQFFKFHSRVKLSSFERDLGLFVINHRQDKPHKNPIKPYQMFLAISNTNPKDTRQFIEQVLLYRGHLELLEAFQKWPMPKFPVNGNMVRDAGISSGWLMGKIIQELKEIWADADFALSAEELLKKIPEIQNTMSPPSKKDKKPNKVNKF